MKLQPFLKKQPYKEDEMKQPAHLHPIMHQCTLFTLGVGNKKEASYHDWEIKNWEYQYKISTASPYTLGAKELRFFLTVVYIYGLPQYQKKQNYDASLHVQGGDKIFEDIDAIELSPRELLTRINGGRSPGAKDYVWLKKTLRSFAAISYWIEGTNGTEKCEYGTYCLKSMYKSNSNGETLSISISPLMTQVAMRQGDARYAIHYLKEQEKLGKSAMLLHWTICNRQHPGTKGINRYSTEKLRTYLYQNKPQHHEQVRRTKSAMEEITKLEGWSVKYNQDRDTWTVTRP